MPRPAGCGQLLLTVGVGVSVGLLLSVGSDEVGGSVGDELSVGELEVVGLLLVVGDELSVGELDVVGLLLVVGDEDVVGLLLPVGDAELADDLGEPFLGAVDDTGETTMVGSSDGLTTWERAGVRNALGEIETAGAGAAAEPMGFVPGTAFEEVAGAVAGPAWACGSTPGFRPAPISATTATAEAATRPPLTQAEASGRDRRRR